MEIGEKLSHGLSEGPGKRDYWQKQYDQLEHNPGLLSDTFQAWNTQVGKMPEKDYTTPLSPIRKQDFGKLSPGEERLADCKALAAAAFTGERMVARAQAALVLAGYSLGDDRRWGIDGINGPKTTKAVCEFQASIGLEATGEVDLETMNALDLVTEKGLTKDEIVALGKQAAHESDSLRQPSQKVKLYTELSPDEQRRVHERDELVKQSQYKDLYTAQSQAALQIAGYDLGKYGIDGVNGPDTRKAIKAFQTDRGLKPTGILDTETRIALDNATIEGWKRPPAEPKGKTVSEPVKTRESKLEVKLEPNRDLYIVNYNAVQTLERCKEPNINKNSVLYNQVKDIQAKLDKMGFDIGSYGVDGVYGRDTRTAVTAFQRAFQLPETGELDSKTAAKIEMEYYKGAEATRMVVAAKAVNHKIETNTMKPEDVNTKYQSTQVNRAHPLQPAITNAVGERSPEKYNQVIDQFDVEKNPRYLPGDGKTYCNIFAWDVTRAMGAEIPHWVNAKGEPCKPGAKGAIEINANLTAKWLKDHGKEYGWVEVTREEAIAAANEGKPTVAVWYNNTFKDGTLDTAHPWSHDWGRSGHIVIVRPKNSKFRITQDSEKNRLGVYIAQAGSKNYQYTIIENGFSAAKMNQTKEPHDYFKYYVHQ